MDVIPSARILPAGVIVAGPQIFAVLVKFHQLEIRYSLSGKRGTVLEIVYGAVIFIVPDTG